MHALVEWLRPQLVPMLAAFPVADEDVIDAAGMLTGMTGTTVAGEEWANPFADWSTDRLAEAGRVALRVRHLLAVTAERLRIDGVVGLHAVQDDPHYVDRRGFSGDHLALLLLLWLEIPLEGRSGAQIAAVLPAMPTVGWYRDDDAMSVTDHASERDLRDVFALRRAWRLGQGRPPIPKPYAAGGRRAKPRAEPVRDARRKAVARVAARFPEVNAHQLRASWAQTSSTPGGLLREELGLQPWDRAPSESTLRLDLHAHNR